MLENAHPRDGGKAAIRVVAIVLFASGGSGRRREEEGEKERYRE